MARIFSGLGAASLTRIAHPSAGSGPRYTKAGDVLTCRLLPGCIQAAEAGPRHRA